MIPTEYAESGVSAHSSESQRIFRHATALPSRGARRPAAPLLRALEKGLAFSIWGVVVAPFLLAILPLAVLTRLLQPLRAQQTPTLDG